SAMRRAASAGKLFRGTGLAPAARRRSGSLAATPIVLVPRTRAISAPRGAIRRGISGRRRTGATMIRPQHSASSEAKRAWLIFTALPLFWMRLPSLLNGTRIMQITWFGHSAFRLDFAGNAVLIDPFFTGNPAFVSDKAAAIKGVSHIVLTHGHSDHVGDALDIAKSNGATVTTNFDLGMWLVSKGLEKF